MNGTTENKIDSLIAELRSFGDRPPPRFAWQRIADELDAAIKEERELLREAAASEMLEGATIIDNRGQRNAAAMREALVRIHNLTNSLDEECGVDPVDIRDIARSALAVPLRQCDVGSADEQLRRWRKFCKNFHYCVDCPADKKDGISADCFANWSQIPYYKGDEK